jgi:hypothetical protein
VSEKDAIRPLMRIATAKIFCDAQGRHRRIAMSETSVVFLAVLILGMVVVGKRRGKK